jgi:uroporphyrinogen-III synthase
MRLIVTRPLAQAQTLVAELRAAGVDAEALPLIDIAAVDDPQPLQRAWREIDGCAMLMFVSANAVLHFMQQRPKAARWPAAVLAACTGPGTAAALREAGVPESAVVEPAGEVFDSEALWLRLAERDWSARRVLVLRGEGGRDWLAERLRAAGATVEFVAAYSRRAPHLDPAARRRLARALARPGEHLWVFSSSEALRHLRALAGQADWSAAAALVTHSRIADSARELGFGRVMLVGTGSAALLRAERAMQARSIQSGAL